MAGAITKIMKALEDSWDLNHTVIKSKTTFSIPPIYYSFCAVLKHLTEKCIIETGSHLKMRKLVMT